MKPENFSSLTEVLHKVLRCLESQLGLQSGFSLWQTVLLAVLDVSLSLPKVCANSTFMNNWKMSLLATIIS